jgi:hypothetical protein
MGVPWPAHAADTCDPLKGDCAPFMLETFDRALDTKDHEYGNARGEHAAVVLRVGACLKGAPSPETWPPVIRSALMLGLNADYMHVEPASPGSKAVVPPLLPFQAAAVFFSDKVSRERLLFARAIENVRGQADRYNFLLVMVGGALTFLAGMQTVIGHSSRWRSLLAMGLGVIVILASSVNSSISRLSDYNANQTESLTSQRALSQLQQLHARIVTDVMKNNDLCAGRDQRQLAVVDAWGARLEKILNDAAPNLAEPGDLVARPPNAKPPIAQGNQHGSPGVPTRPRSFSDPETVASASR